MGLSQYEFAKLCGITPAYLSQMLGRKKEVNLKYILPALKDRISINWLISGTEPMIIGEVRNALTDEASTQKKPLPLPAFRKKQDTRDSITMPLFEEGEAIPDETLSIFREGKQTSAFPSPKISLPQDMLSIDRLWFVTCNALHGKTFTPSFFSIRLNTFFDEESLKKGDIGIYRRMYRQEVSTFFRLNLEADLIVSIYYIGQGSNVISIRMLTPLANGVYVHKRGFEEKGIFVPYDRILLEFERTGTEEIEEETISLLGVLILSLRYFT